MKLHGAKELAQSHVFSVTLGANKKQETDASLHETISLKRSSMRLEDELGLILMQLRFQIEDYLNENYFDPKKDCVGFPNRVNPEFRKKNKKIWFWKSTLVRQN